VEVGELTLAVIDGEFHMVMEKWRGWCRCGSHSTPGGDVRQASRRRGNKTGTSHADRARALGQDSARVLPNLALVVPVEPELGEDGRNLAGLLLLELDQTHLPTTCAKSKNFGASFCKRAMTRSVVNSLFARRRAKLI